MPRILLTVFSTRVLSAGHRWFSDWGIYGLALKEPMKNLQLELPARLSMRISSRALGLSWMLTQDSTDGRQRGNGERLSKGRG